MWFIVEPFLMKPNCYQYNPSISVFQVPKAKVVGKKFSSFKDCSDLKYQQICSGGGAGNFGNGGKVRLCQSFKLQLAVGAKVNEYGLPGEKFTEL